MAEELQSGVEGPVCVTGASGFLGSCLVGRLLHQGFTVRATVRDPGNLGKTKHLLDLPAAKERLTLWKADLREEGSFDAAIDGCRGVFHLATPMDFHSRNPEMYFVAKTLAEKAAWEFAEQSRLDLVTVIPTLVVGPFAVPAVPPSLVTALALITRKEEHYSILRQVQVVHPEDACNALLFVYRRAEAKGRFICSSHDTTILRIAQMLAGKYPEYDVPTRFDDADESLEVLRFSSEKLTKMGFRYRHSMEEMFDGAIRSCREKGLI